MGVSTNIESVIGGFPSNGTEQEKKVWRAAYQKHYYRLNEGKAKAYQKKYAKNKKGSSPTGKTGRGRRTIKFILQRERVRTTFSRSDLQRLTPTEFAKTVNQITDPNHRAELV